MGPHNITSHLAPFRMKHYFIFAFPSTPFCFVLLYLDMNKKVQQRVENTLGSGRIFSVRREF